jgi:tetratricopeptide (TPR) repeat protein
VPFVDPLLSGGTSSTTVRALPFDPLLRLDWFTFDTGAYYSNDWLVLQSEERFRFFDIEISLNLLAQRYDRLKSGAVHESRITRRWDVARSARGAQEEREREISRLERAADLIQEAAERERPLEQVGAEPVRGRTRLETRAADIRRLTEKLSDYAHLADLFDEEKNRAWEGEPRYSGVSRVHHLRALRRIAAGRWAQATEELERAIRCDPDDAGVRKHRLLLCARLGRLELGERDADWLAQRSAPARRTHFVGWRAYFRFCRDRLEEAKSDARTLWPELEGEPLAEHLTALLRAREEMAHTLHVRWLAQFTLGDEPVSELPAIPAAKRAEPAELVDQALIEAAEMGGGRILIGPSRADGEVMVVLQPAEGAGYWMARAPGAQGPEISKVLRDGSSERVARRRFNFRHAAVDHQIDAGVRELESGLDAAELWVTPLRRGADSYELPAGTARPVRTAVLGFLESNVADAQSDRINGALIRGLGAASTIPIVRGRTAAYAGITLHDAAEDIAGALGKIRAEYNAERFVYARLDTLPEIADSALRDTLTLVAGDAWINHAELARSYGLYDRSDLETSVEIAAQDFAAGMIEAGLAPAAPAPPEFPPAEPKRRVEWLKLMAGHHELKFDRPRAIAHLREAAAAERSEPGLKAALGLLLQGSGEFAEASEILKDAAERMEDLARPAADRARARRSLARALGGSGNLAGAAEELLSAGRLSDDDPELGASAQRALRYLGLEALEQTSAPETLFFLGRALGDLLLLRTVEDLPAGPDGALRAAFAAHYERVLRRKVPATLRAALEALETSFVEAANRLWLETDRLIGEEMGLAGRLVLRLGRLERELRNDPREEWAATGKQWVEWILAHGPRSCVDALGGSEGFDGPLAARLEKIDRASAARRRPPAARFAAQRIDPPSWSAPHLEIAPIPEIVALEDDRVLLLRDGRYVELEGAWEAWKTLEPDPRPSPGWWVSIAGRRGFVPSLSEPPDLPGKVFSPPIVRLIYWKTREPAEAPPLPAVLQSWLEPPGVDAPRFTPPWITLPSGPPRGWKCRDVWGEFVPEEMLRFSAEPKLYSCDGVACALLMIPAWSH